MVMFAAVHAEVVGGIWTGIGDRTGPAGREHGEAAGDGRAPRVEPARRLRDRQRLRDAPCSCPDLPQHVGGLVFLPLFSDEADLVIGDEGEVHLAVEGQQLVEQEAPGLEGERAEAGLAIATDEAAAAGCFGQFLDAVSEFRQRLEVLVSGVNEGGEGVVLFDDGAGPAAEAGGGGSAGGGVVHVDDERAFAAGRVLVERDDLPVGTAPRWSAVEKRHPDFVCGEFLDGGEHPDALVGGMGGQGAFRGVLVPGDGSCPGGGFGATHAEQEDGLAVVGDDVADEAGGGPDFHPVGAPAEGAIGGGITLAEEVDPEAFLRQRLGADDADWDIEAFEALFEAFEEAIHEVLEDRGLDLGVVADDVDASATVLRGHVADGLQHEVQ